MGECLESNSSIYVSHDKARSLIDIAAGRKEFLDKNEVNENSANYVFEGYYSSVLELLHALLLLQGYKVSNHICLGYYVRDVMQKPDLFRLFDDCRYKRNSLIYYGKKMDLATAEKAIEKCKKLVQILNDLIVTS